MADLLNHLALEIQLMYEEIVRRGPALWVAASCLALILACLIAFGVHP